MDLLPRLSFSTFTAARSTKRPRRTSLLAMDGGVCLRFSAAISKVAPASQSNSSALSLL
jgi:hypothetical protein